MKMSANLRMNRDTVTAKVNWRTAYEAAASPSSRQWLPCAALGLLLALPAMSADRRENSWSSESRGRFVERPSHGTIRHSETHVVPHSFETRREPERHVEVHRDVFSHPETFRHHDVEVDVHRHHYWNDFVFGHHLPALPFGFLTLHIGGVPYYYSNGIYYQPANGGYQEVYPPVGAAVPQPPDGSIRIDAGGQSYYYAGGAFYLQQPDGTFAIAPTPMGVVVPELPPGAIQVSANGQVAYQFNGIYYRPVFVNGVTQYETFMP